MFAILNFKINMLGLAFYSHGKHLHDRIISLRWDAWDHRTSLTPPLY